MWSKAPFNRSRRETSNPTSADIPSEDPSAAAEPVRADRYSKELPALPNDSESSLPDTPNLRAKPIQLGLDVSGANRYSAVSPLGSPALLDSGSSFCVSPIDDIDESPSRMRGDSRTSGIVAPSNRDNASPSPPPTALPVPKTVQFAPSQDTQPTRWDDFSGEPTTNNLGRASHVNPRNNTFHKASSSHASNFLHWGRGQLQPKKKLAKARNRISSLSRYEAPTEKETRGRTSSYAFTPGHSSNSQTTTTPQLHNLGLVPTVVTTITAGSSRPLPETPAAEHAYLSDREDQGRQDQQEQGRQDQQDQQNSKFDTAIARMMQSVQHPTPYNTTQMTANATTDGDSAGNSPNASPRDSLAFASVSNDDLTSIMSRRRPVPLAIPTSRKPVRKPTPSQAASQPTPSPVVQEPEPAPQPPPVEPPKDAHGRIMSLEIRRDELKKRRFNLETVIHELTRVIQPGSITYDLAAKAEVKKSVQSIENEIAEIKKEEHELGMKVSRAWRRLDEKENHGDGSNLWVKRVTS